MHSTTATGRRASRGAKPWLWCKFFFLLASAPLAHAGDPAVEQRAQACDVCHGPHGQSSNPTLPSLAGQTSQYIYEQLRDFGAGRRQSATMTPIAKTLSSDDMQKLADYGDRLRKSTEDIHEAFSMRPRRLGLPHCNCNAPVDP
jgi:cytochrome c553